MMSLKLNSTMTKKHKTSKFKIGDRVKFFTRGGFSTQKGEIVGFLILVDEPGIGIQSVLARNLINEDS